MANHRALPTRWVVTISMAAAALVALLIFAVGTFSKDAEATGGGGNEDCPAGTVLIAKFEWSGHHYDFEKPAGNQDLVSISGDASGGTWTAAVPISYVILKGGTAADTTHYVPAAFAGTFSKLSLPKNHGGQHPDISNIQFCGTVTTPAGLRVVKSVVWNGAVPDPATTFSVCVQGPSFSTPNCKTVDFDGGTVTWMNLLPGSYSVTEASPDPAWSVDLPPNVTVVAGQVASANVTNTYLLGSLDVVKSVDWSVIPPDTSETFQLCITGPSYPTASCKSTPYDGGTVSWSNLVPGQYAVSEYDPHQNTWTVTIDATPVTVPTGGGTATVQVHNQRILPQPKVMFTVESQPVCLPNAQTITAEGMAHLPGTMAGKMIGTWQVTLPGWAPAEDRVVHTVDLGVVHDLDTRSWDANWPGIHYGDTEARVHFTVALYSEDGVTRIAGPEEMDYYWTPDVCPGPASGNLKVIKVDLGDASASGTWTFNAVGPTAPADVNITNTGNATFSSLAPGDYTVTETTGHTSTCQPGGSDVGDFETRHGASGDPTLSEAGTAISVNVRSDETATVYFFNRNCGAVLGSPTLYIQKYEDLTGDRTGSTGIAGFQFVVKRNGVPLGDPFISPADGLIIVPGLDGAIYTVEEIVPDGYTLTGSRVDADADGTYDNEYVGQPPELELMHAGDGARVAFYNQPRVNIRVAKQQTDSGVTTPGAGWTFTSPDAASTANPARPGLTER